MTPNRMFLLWFLAVLFTRIGLNATYDGYLGVDGGAYWLGLHRFVSEPGPYLDASWPRPPLAPGFLLWPFQQVFGNMLGFNLYQAVFATSIIPPFYLLARRLLPAWWAVAATVGISLDWPLAEMAVTGVVPITGFGAMCLALWGLINISDDRHPFHWPSWLAVIIGIPLIAHTNQTALGISLVVFPLTWLLLRRKRDTLTALIGGGLVALTALPWYLEVLPGSPRVNYPGSLVGFHFWWESQWYQLAFSLPLAVMVWRSSAWRPARLIALLVGVHAVLQVFISSDETLMNIFYRSSYWISIPWWLGAAWLGSRYQWRWLARVGRRTLYAAGALALAVGIYGAQDQFYGQAYYSNLAGPDVLTLLERIPDDGTIIGTNAESRGYWIAAITKRPVMWVQPALPNGYFASVEVQGRCELGWTDCDERGHVGWWLIETAQTQQIKALILDAPNPENAWNEIGEHAPWLELVAQEGTVQLWRYSLTGLGAGL